VELFGVDTLLLIIVELAVNLTEAGRWVFEGGGFPRRQE
jgi:hypothetical protein